MIPTIGPAQIVAGVLMLAGAVAVLTARSMVKKNPEKGTGTKVLIGGAALCLAGALVGWFA